MLGEEHRLVAGGFHGEAQACATCSLASQAHRTSGGPSQGSILGMGQ